MIILWQSVEIKRNDGVLQVGNQAYFEKYEDSGTQLDWNNGRILLYTNFRGRYVSL